jgi:hypothetical protein
MNHCASTTVPASLAKPLPPLSLVQRTWYRRMLSRAPPFSDTKPLEGTSLWASTQTDGGAVSSERQRRRSVSDLGAAAGSISTWLGSAVGSSAPPQATSPMEATA